MLLPPAVPHYSVFHAMPGEAFQSWGISATLGLESGCLALLIPALGEL